MGWFAFAACAAPGYLLYGSSHTFLWITAIVNAIANLWSFGVMHNYAVEGSASQIRRLRAGLEEEGRLDAEAQVRLDAIEPKKNLDAVPTWLTTVNMATTVVGILLLLYSLTTT